MLSAFPHVITAGTTATLLWIAGIGLAVLAVVLYFPQKFSGPLTTHERSAFRGVLRRRSIALVFAAPIATLAGFFALLPPIVTLRVPPPVVHASGDSALYSFPLDPVALERSTEPWMTAVRCRITEDVVGEQTLATAIVTAAHEGFSIDCDSPRTLGLWARTSVELSLIEIAARAYLIAGVELDPGPRRQDPDPWDIMADNLSARGIAVHVDGRDGASTGAGILRLTRARLSGADAIQVHGLVDACEASYEGRLLHPDGSIAVPSCNFVTAKCDPSLGQQLVEMSVTCAGFRPAEHEGGLLLAAGQGETPLRFETREPIQVRVEDEHLREALTKEQNSTFIEEMRRRSLRRLEVVEEHRTTIHRDARVVGPHVVEPNCQLPPEHGPFSWTGMERPVIRREDKSIKIGLRPEVFDRSHASYDPTEMMAALATLTWAANAVETGICSEGEEFRADSPRIARPLLTLAEMDAVVMALRRDRDSVGLVLLAFAVLSLALGLRRSVR